MLNKELTQLINNYKQILSLNYNWEISIKMKHRLKQKIKVLKLKKVKTYFKKNLRIFKWIAKIYLQKSIFKNKIKIKIRNNHFCKRFLNKMKIFSKFNFKRNSRLIAQKISLSNNNQNCHKKLVLLSKTMKKI